MQAEYENVKIVSKANIYYDGKVISHTFFMPDGSRKTTGVIFPGEYEFGTGPAEVMEMVSGAFTVMLPGSSKWETYEAGKSFNIPGNDKFKLKCTVLSEYVCSYAKE